MYDPQLPESYCAPDIVLLGDPQIDRIELLDGRQVESLGSAAVYAGAALVALDDDAGIVGHVGDDLSPDQEDRLYGLGVDLAGLGHDAPATTRGVLRQIDEKDREYVVEQMATSIRSDDVPDNYLGAQLFYVCPVNGYATVHTDGDERIVPVEMPVETLRHLAEETDAVIMLDAQGYTRFHLPDGHIEPWSWDERRSFLRYVDVLKVSDDPESRLLTTLKYPVEAAVELYRELVEIHGSDPRRREVVIVTLGAEGSLVVEDDTVYHVPAALPDDVVDTTGAGDTYGAGFAHAYARDPDAVEAALIGSVVASFVVEAPGIDSVPSLDQVIDRLAAQNDRLQPTVIARIKGL